jgi:hypothetical protein
MTSPNKTFAVWYEANKDKLSQKRKEQYANDPEYRAKVLARSEAFRLARRGVSSLPGYEFNMQQAADQVGVTLWTLREWRKKNYFPEPLEYQGKLMFNASQIELLQGLRKFFDDHGVRTSAANRPALEDLTSLVYANWM